MNETISAIIAFSLPVIFHVLITYKVNMKVILVITGSLVGLSVLLANGFKSVFQHWKTIVNVASIIGIIVNIIRQYLSRNQKEEVVDDVFTLEDFKRTDL